MRETSIKAYQSVNSFNNELIQTFDDITDAQLETKLAAAAKCFAVWKRKS